MESDEAQISRKISRRVSDLVWSTCSYSCTVPNQAKIGGGMGRKKCVRLPSETFDETSGTRLSILLPQSSGKDRL